jgi:hypothetical protein
MPVYLFLAGHDRIIDNGATLELLAPVLRQTRFLQFAGYPENRVVVFQGVMSVPCVDRQKRSATKCDCG